MRIDEIRCALADYMYAEGCSCCRNEDAHEKARNELAKLLGVRKKGGWYDFSKFRTVDRRKDD